MLWKDLYRSTKPGFEKFVEELEATVRDDGNTEQTINCLDMATDPNNSEPTRVHHTVWLRRAVGTEQAKVISKGWRDFFNSRG